MGKLVEGLWDCPFCDNKRIRAGQKTCPNCGHPQDENTKFYMPDAIEYVSEEKAAKTAAQCAVTVVQKRLTVPVAMLPYPLEAELPAATARR